MARILSQKRRVSREAVGWTYCPRAAAAAEKYYAIANSTRGNGGKNRVDDAIGHLRKCRMAFMAAKKEEVNATALQLLKTQMLHKTSRVFSGDVKYE